MYNIKQSRSVELVSKENGTIQLNIIKRDDCMATEIDGKMFDVGDQITVNGRKGIVWKFYKAEGVSSVAIKYDHSVYEMFLTENIVLDD